MGMGPSADAEGDEREDDEEEESDTREGEGTCARPAGGGLNDTCVRFTGRFPGGARVMWVVW